MHVNIQYVQLFLQHKFEKHLRSYKHMRICLHKISHAHEFSWCSDFDSNSFLQHAGDERIRLEELRQKVLIYFLFKCWK